MADDDPRKRKRNPSWSRDELIVTLDFYVRHAPSIPSKTSREIAELSAFLNQLRVKVGMEGDERFRNSNGVYMKLMNFRRFDPSYSGSGLERGGREDEVVWNLYADQQIELHRAAEAIRSFVNSHSELSFIDVPPNDEEESEEGRILTRVHRVRERDTRLVQRKKQAVMRETGVLSCEVCDFDFSEAYGLHGEGFIECHHKMPVSEMRSGDRTQLNDLSLVCANCHRMIHRKRPWLTIEQLQKLFQNV